MSEGSLAPEEVGRLLAEYLRRLLDGGPAAGLAAAPDLPQLVTLDQAAALVERSKRSLEYYRRHPRHQLPDPTVEGGGGRPHLWDWRVMRPWLERTFRARLPERLPDVHRRT